MQATGLKIPGFHFTAWFSIAFLYIPIVILIVFSFNAGNLITVWDSFSTKWYTAALKNEELANAAKNSLIIGAVSTVISTAIALMVALVSFKNNAESRSKKWAEIIMPLPLLIPEIVLAIATLSFFSLLDIRWGIGNILIAHIVFCIPFAYSPIRARLENIPHSLLEAASDLYATPGRAFYHVIFPLLMPGIVSGALLAFISSLDDFIITQLVAPPGAMTLPVYIYSMVRRGITPEINAASSMLLGVSIIFVLASYLINRKKVL